MTDVEAIDVLNRFHCFHIDSIRDKAIDQAMKALEEIQAYKVIGTVEEINALKEKDTPKKPIDKSKNQIDWHIMACPCCNYTFWNSGQFFHYEPKYCDHCGQKLDWE